MRCFFGFHKWGKWLVEKWAYQSFERLGSQWIDSGMHLIEMNVRRCILCLKEQSKPR